MKAIYIDNKAEYFENGIAKKNEYIGDIVPISNLNKSAEMMDCTSHNYLIRLRKPFVGWTASSHDLKLDRNYTYWWIEKYKIKVITIMESE